MPTVCDGAALRGHAAVFGLRRCTGSAFMLAICFTLPLSVAALRRSVQYDSAESQPQRGTVRGLRYALEQVPLVTLFASLRGYSRLDVSWVVSSAHSRFKMPIPAEANSTCNRTPRSTTAELIRHTKLIVWDEAPMSVWCTRPNTCAI